MTAAFPLDFTYETPALDGAAMGVEMMIAQIDASLSTGRSVSAVPAPFAQYRDNPVGFFREVLGVEPWGRPTEPCAACRAAGRAWCIPPNESAQAEVLEAVRDHDLVAVRGGHKLYKSNSLAGLAIWWVQTRPRGHVILTAPSYDQVKKPGWAEIRSLVARSHPAQAGKHLPELSGTIHLEPHSGYELAPNWGIWGKSTTEPEKIAGPSGADVLYMVDEASGFDADLLTAIMGGLAGGGKLVLWGNPTRTSGPFYDAFHSKRAAWKTLHTSSLSSPNFHGGNVPGLAGPRWHDTIAKPSWIGPGNPLYDIRVLGNFPRQGDMVVVSLDLLEAARARWETTPEDNALDIGVDVAREGDDNTVAAPRRGLRALPLATIQISRAPGAAPPGHQVGDAVAALARSLKRPTDRRKPRIKIDEIGVGSAVLDYMVATYSKEFDIFGVNSGSAADKHVKISPDRTAYDAYRNKRTQMGFGVQAWLMAGGALPGDERLAGDLVAPMFFFVGQGKQAIEEKSEIKKRLGRSPDDGDALALSVYEPVEEHMPIEVLSVPQSSYRYSRNDHDDHDEPSGSRYGGGNVF